MKTGQCLCHSWILRLLLTCRDRDRKRVTVTVAGVNGGADFQVSLGYFVGDFNDSRAVNASDISAQRTRLAQAVNANNFRFDLNADGAIDSSDTSLVKGRSGLVMP